MQKIIVLVALILAGCDGYMSPKNFSEATDLCDKHQGVKYAWRDFWQDNVHARCNDGIRLDLSK